MNTLISLFSLNIIPFLIILSILVFVHELGHYCVAKYNGVKVEVFSIGFGPELFGWTDASGTRWKVSLVPLGGYVKMFSDLNAASQPDQSQLATLSEAEKGYSLHHKTVWQRMAVSVAGPGANYLFATLVLALLYTFIGQRVPSFEPKLGTVTAQSPADLAGLKPNDIITAINNQPITTFSDMQGIVMKNPLKSLTFTVKRQSETFFANVTPSLSSGSTPTGQLGVGQGYDYITVPFYKAPYNAFMDCIHISWHTLKLFGKMITGQVSADGLSGPIGIANLIGKAASEGWVELMWISAMLSISLGLINLLPVPLLDGGHLLFYIIEAVRGKPVSEKIQDMAFNIGFVLVISLMLYSTWNDLSRLHVVTWIKNFF